MAAASIAPLGSVKGTRLRITRPMGIYLTEHRTVLDFTGRFIEGIWAVTAITLSSGAGLRF
jgi:hypothetical protein